MKLKQAIAEVALRLVELWVINYCPDCEEAISEDILILTALKTGKCSGLSPRMEKAVTMIRKRQKQEEVLEGALILLAA